MIPTKVKRTKPQRAPKTVTRAARFMLPAPMFWPTKVETAIDRPMAGIVTTCKIFDPTPYAAIVNVPKLATKNDITIRPNPRVDNSTDPGNPKKKAYLMYFRSGRKLLGDK